MKFKTTNNIKIIDKIKVTAKNKDISENKIYQLEANYFNWLSITNEIENKQYSFFNSCWN
ncbi:hypothetical protein GL981_12935 (plasmid) [Spiroplasma citri]|nr:hypothetical protein GL981_12935 [Spiroplasma citri]